MSEVTPTGGWTPQRTIAAANTNATLVKAAPGTLGGYYFCNAAAYPVFWKFYDSKIIPTAGAGTPVLTFEIPAGAAGNVGFGNGIQFLQGIGFTMTKLIADADTTALAAADLVANLLYV